MSDEKKIKHMSDLLKSGATMLSEQCPACSSLLFKIHDEVWCPNCNKRVVILKEGEQAPSLIDTALLGDIEGIVLTKLQEISQQIRNEKNPEKLQGLGNLISVWLEVLERLKRIQKSSP